MKWAPFVLVMAAAAMPTSAFLVLPRRSANLAVSSKQSLVMVAMGKRKKSRDITAEEFDADLQEIGDVIMENFLRREVHGRKVTEINGSTKEAVDTSNEEVVVVEEDNLNEEVEEEKLSEQDLFDAQQMQHAIQMAQSAGGERGSGGPYPKPIAGAVIVTKDGKILGRGRSDYQQDAVRAAIADAGIDATPLREWVVSWPSNRQLREALVESTLYVTLEPSEVRHGEALPPTTQLIGQSGIPRVVIGCPDPIPERAMEGAAALHSAGLEVRMGVNQEECEHVIEQYAELANSKLQVQARKHAQRFGRPLGFLHCSVVDSDDAEAFARHGNAFGKNFGGKRLSFREFGSYEIAPPPELVWAADTSGEDDDFETEMDDIFNMEFDEEDYQGEMGRSPMMPW